MAREINPNNEFVRYGAHEYMQKVGWLEELEDFIRASLLSPGGMFQSEQALGGSAWVTWGYHEFDVRHVADKIEAGNRVFHYLGDVAEAAYQECRVYGRRI